MTSLRIQVLGPLRVWRDGRPVRPGPAGVQALLGVLALNAGQPTSRAEITETLWRDRPPPTASNVIQTYVRRLRRILEPDRRAYGSSTLVPRISDGYALLVSDVDALRFRKLVTRDDADGLRAALRLWKGVPLTGIPALARHRSVQALVEQHRAALARYGELMIEAGTATEAIGMLEDAAADHQVDEAAYARLIRAYRSLGRVTDALRAYRVARHRLAAELGVDPGPELTAATTTLRTIPAQLPADVRGFVGRTTELSEIDTALAANGAVFVIAGSAGVGKTAFAVRFGHRAGSRFPGGQLYIDLRGYDSARPLSAGYALVRLLGALGVLGADVPADTAARAKLLRAELTGRNVLLLLDNVNSADQVRPFLPCPPSCAIVVTSRDPLPTLDAHYRTELGALTRVEALALLTSMIGARVTAEPRAADVLVDQCARLPLALRVAAELVTSRPRIPLSALLTHLTSAELAHQ